MLKSKEVEVPAREIRAQYSASTITVYQAFSPEITDPSLAAGRFVAPFKRTRMTWIKPSILWMAYRSGWATKPGQERVLAIEITRTGFEWALAHSCLSHYESGTYLDQPTWQTSKAVSPVRVQWDPERDLHHHGLKHRAIQIGLSGRAVDKYVDDWVLSLTDITSTMRQIHDYVEHGQLEAAHQLLPSERPYPLSTEVAAAIGAS